MSNFCMSCQKDAEIQTTDSVTSPVRENTEIAQDIIDENRSHYQSLLPHPRDRERDGFQCAVPDV